MSSIEEDLAWTLADTVGEWLPGSERHRVYIALGIGDSLAAIKLLLEGAVQQRVPLPAEILESAEFWLASYRGSVDEQMCGDLLGQLSAASG